MKKVVTYTKDEIHLAVLAAVRQELDEANKACGITKTTSFDYQVIGVVSLAMKRLK